MKKVECEKEGQNRWTKEGIGGGAPAALSVRGQQGSIGGHWGERG